MEKKRQGLSSKAYEEIPGDQYEPYVEKSAGIPEFTLRSIIAGSIFGMLFGASNAYLGLKSGLTVATSIPIAVMSVALFRLWKDSTILETNMSQTVGSASSSLASGVIFTIPALFLWGLSPGIVQIAFLAGLGGILGILFMIPLRRFLIKEEHGKLLYPEGTACAEVLVASEAGGTQARSVFYGLGAGFVYNFFMKFLNLWPDKASFSVPKIKKALFGIETSPALLGVGYILGFRVSAILVAGGLVSWMVLIPMIAHFGEHLTIPLFPETVKLIRDMTPNEIWNRYIRYIGAGGVACGGIITISKSIPTIVQSIKIGIKEISERLSNTVTEKLRTDRDLPLHYVGLMVLLVIAILAVVPHIIGSVDSFAMRLVAAVCIAIFAFFFVIVSSRIVGLIGVSSNPTSGMAIFTLLGTSFVFLLLGWTDMVGKTAALTIGTVVCVAASIAGDTSQDLKTGFLIGATPNKQQIGEMIGVVTSMFAVAGAILLLNKAYTFGSEELAAPQATLMKTVIEGVLSRDLPWNLVLMGAALAVFAEICSIPSLPFAVGVYLPLSTMTPIFAGGCIRYFIEKKYMEEKDVLMEKRERGILFGSGLIAGVGLLMMILSIYTVIRGERPEGIGPEWLGSFDSIFALLTFIVLAYLLVRITKVKKAV